MALSHDDLSASLAAHLAGEHRMVWEDMQLGPAGSPRPDVYSMMRSFAQPAPMAYECKVSRADFLSDVTSGKWTSYLSYAYGVVFACEGDLIKKADVPQHCGLIVLRGAWRMAKRPVLNPVTIPQEALLKLVIDGVSREGPKIRARMWAESIALDKVRKKFGQDVATAVRDMVAAQREIECSEYRAKQIIELAEVRAKSISEVSSSKIDTARKELLQALKMDAGSNVYQIQNRIADIEASLREHPAQKKWRRMSEVIRRALEFHGYKAEEKEVEVES